MAKSTDDALHLLDDFDVPDAPAPPKSSGQAPIEGDAAEALAFLDELTTQKPAPGPNAAAATLERKQSAPLLRPSSRASLQAPTQRRSVEQTRAAIAAARSGSPAPDRDRGSATPSPAPAPAQQQAQSSAGGWGWGSVWSAASAARTAATAAVQQARTVVDEQVKHLPNNEQARKWGEGMMEYVKQAQLDKIGASSQEMRDKGLATFTDILNVVAPPISEHEVIQVWLSHDMVGYDGVENLVYRALARIMEQVEGGDLVVNKGNESRPKEGSDDARNLNAVDDQDAALRLAKANLEDLAKIKAADTDAPKPESSLQNPTTYSSVYLRIQPFFATHSLINPPATADEKAPAPAPVRHLHFLLYLQDPSHKLEHATVSQAVPERWLELWDEYDWVEDLVAESLRVSTEIIGQEYVVERMGWGTKKPTPIEGAVDVSAQEEVQVEKS
ncbi:hypothetical protein AURDEDRAFT_78614 [Auricularia subglabra TFB-10046 SS5]|nr:hypothetical protein AURDEDRAFT_78614 [Auricularia subglabra TFB-10046 SS5]